MFNSVISLIDPFLMMSQLIFVLIRRKSQISRVRVSQPTLLPARFSESLNQEIYQFYNFELLDDPDFHAQTLKIPDLLFATEFGLAVFYQRFLTRFFAQTCKMINLLFGKKKKEKSLVCNQSLSRRVFRSDQEFSC